MNNRGWLGFAAGVAIALAACGQQDSGGSADTAEADILSATESYRDFGDYTLHFNTLTTNQLDERIASEYGIVRSPNRVLLNVSVLQNQEIGLATPVEAEVTAGARNLTNQARNIDIQEVREQDAIYYLGETTIVNAESLVFTVEASVEGRAEPLVVSFQKQFFVDD